MRKNYLLIAFGTMVLLASMYIFSNLNQWEMQSDLRSIYVAVGRVGERLSQGRTRRITPDELRKALMDEPGLTVVSIGDHELQLSIANVTRVVELAQSDSSPEERWVLRSKRTYGHGLRWIVTPYGIVRASQFRD